MEANNFPITEYVKLMKRLTLSSKWEDEEPTNGNYDLDAMRKEFQKRLYPENQEK